MALHTRPWLVAYAASFGIERRRGSMSAQAPESRVALGRARAVAPIAGGGAVATRTRAPLGPGFIVAKR